MTGELSRLLKKLGADKLLLLLLAGVLLMLSFKTDGQKESTERETAAQIQQPSKGAEEQLEDRLLEILETAYGIGRVCVMITMEESENKVLATIEDECIFDGDSPYVIKNEAPKIRGVVVILRGVTTPGAALEITQACEVLFGVSSNKVKVINQN